MSAVTEPDVLTYLRTESTSLAVARPMRDLATAPSPTPDYNSDDMDLDLELSDMARSSEYNDLNALDFLSPLLSIDEEPVRERLQWEHVQTPLGEPALDGGLDDEAVDSVIGEEDANLRDDIPLPCLQPGEQGALGPVFHHSADWDQHKIEGYAQHVFYCINYDKNLVLLDHAIRELKLHRERCVLMTRFFEEYTYAEIKDVHFPPNSTLADWEEYWAEERISWTGRTLVHIYLNGKSRKTYGNKKEFWWVITGIREQLNAYKWMESLNLTNADITYLLDCWVYTRFPRFYREHAMTEIIVAGPSEPDAQFKETAIRHGDFASGFRRILSDYVSDVPGRGWAARDCRMQSTPMIMRHNKTLNNNALRIWDLKPSKRSADQGIEIWRTVTDPLHCWATGKMIFLRKQIQPKPVDEELEPEDVDPEVLGMEEIPPYDGQDDAPDDDNLDDEGLGDMGDIGTSGNGGGGDDDDGDNDMDDAAASFPTNQRDNGGNDGGTDEDEDLSDVNLETRGSSGDINMEENVETAFETEETSRDEDEDKDEDEDENSLFLPK